VGQIKLLLRVEADLLQPIGAPLKKRSPGYKCWFSLHRSALSGML